MDVLVLELMEVIRHEVKAFEELLDAMAEEQNALVAHDLARIQATVVQQGRLIGRSKQLEQVRASVVKKLSQNLAEDAESLTLRRLIERLEGPDATQLAEMRDTLIGLQGKIQRANQHNAMLIRQSMRYVDKSLELLTGSGPAAGVYGNTGKVSGGKPKVNAVLNQVA